MESSAIKAEDKYLGKKEKSSTKFVKNPFKFTKELLGKERPATLYYSKEEVEGYLHETFKEMRL